VLLILDCCFATLAAKSGQLGRLSLLAAAPDNGKTPSPGPYSFTRFFVAETRSVLREQRFVRLSELPSRIHQRSICSDPYAKFSRWPTGQPIGKAVDLLLYRLTYWPTGRFGVWVNLLAKWSTGVPSSQCYFLPQNY